MDFVLFPPWMLNPRMVFMLSGCVFVKNQPKKSRLDTYNFFLCMYGIGLPVGVQMCVKICQNMEGAVELLIRILLQLTGYP